MHSYSCTHVYIFLDRSNVYIFAGLGWCASATRCIEDSIRGSFYLYASWGVPLVVCYIFETLYTCLLALEIYTHVFQYLEDMYFTIYFTFHYFSTWMTCISLFIFYVYMFIQELHEFLYIFHIVCYMHFSIDTRSRCSFLRCMYVYFLYFSRAFFMGPSHIYSLIFTN